MKAIVAADIVRPLDRDVEEIVIRCHIIVARRDRIGRTQKECVDLIGKEWIAAVNELLAEVETKIKKHPWSC